MATRKLLGLAAVLICFAGGGLAGSIILPALAGSGSGAVSTSHTAAPAPMAEPGPGGPGPRADRGPGGPGGQGPGGGLRRGDMPVDVSTVASVLHMPVDDLIAALRGGSSIAEVATGRGIDVQGVIDTLVAKASASSNDSSPAALRQSITAMVMRTLAPRR
jgi:hypothetical protein